MQVHACTGWQVIEHAHTGRYLHTFADEWLAVRFAVSIGSQAVPFTIAY